jgi:hypothetical protein
VYIDEGICVCTAVVFLAASLQTIWSKSVKDLTIQWVEKQYVPPQSAQASHPSSATQQQHNAARHTPRQPLLPPLFLGAGGGACWYCIGGPFKER